MTDAFSGILKAVEQRGEDVPMSEDEKRAARQREFLASALTGAQLMAAEFPEPNWVIDELIPEGLTVLAGAPKIGKSYLCLQLLQAISAGGQLFNKRATKLKTAYIALEDPPRRLQQRLNEQGYTGSGNDLILTSANMDTPYYLMDHFDVIIIDTFSRLLQRTSLDQFKSADMTNILGELQTYAHKKNKTLIVADHHKKGVMYSPSDIDFIDPVNDLYGSVAKSAAADVIAGMYKIRGMDNRVFAAWGKEIGPSNYEISFDPRLHIWTSHGMASPEKIAVQNSTELTRVLDAIHELEKAGENAYGSKISDLSGMAAPNVTRTLKELQGLFPFH